MSVQEDSVRAHPPAEAGTALEPAPSPELGVNDPRLTRFDLVREGARRDGIDIALYEPRFEPGSRVEKRLVRGVAALFLLAGASGLAFLVAYVAWPWEYADTEFSGSSLQRFYTPVLGVTLGLTLFFLGAGIVSWVKKLLPHEVAIEQRHDGPSATEDQRITAATLSNVAAESGITRRPLLAGAVVLGLLPLAAVVAAPLIGGLIRDPHRPDPRTGLPRHEFTGFNPALNGGQPVRLVLEDGTPLRPADISVAGQVTVFPGIPGGATNQYAESPTLLIHLRQDDAEALRQNLYQVNEGSMAGNYVAYSKVCTHAGCPPSLYEQQTNHLLCPCHQSQFLITDNARPIFGPAARSLPMLPIGLDDEGYFVATQDYQVPVGPSYWER
jgi:ubiquinol-cytochrome c reductase iron-sulfur subunit